MGGIVSNPGIFSSGENGLVPASGGGTTNFLRADGTFNVPSGGSGAGETMLIPYDIFRGNSGSAYATKGLQAYFSYEKTCSKISAFFLPDSGGTYKAYIVELDGSEQVTSILAESAEASGLPLTYAAYEFIFTECVLSASTRYGFLLVRTDGSGTSVLNIGFSNDAPAINVGAYDVYSLRAELTSISVSDTLLEDTPTAYLACPVVSQ